VISRPPAGTVRPVAATASILLALLVSVSVSVSVSHGTSEPVPPESRITRITHDGNFKQRPAWSSDGQHLVYARHRGATIYLIHHDLKSKQEERLTKNTHPEYDAVFAPDNKSLLYAYDKASPNQGDIEVHQLNFETRISRPIAVTEGKLSHEESPCWSPDGQRIAFTSTRHGNQELYVAGQDGKDPVRLTSHPAIDAHPSWSPDGKQIAFATNTWGDLEIALIRPDGTGLRRLTNSRGLDDYPAWSPDGRWIAFTSNRDRNLEIYVYEVSSGSTENVTRQPSIDNFPAWTADGQLSFISNRDSGFDIYVTDPPGNE